MAIRTMATALLFLAFTSGLPAASSGQEQSAERPLPSEGQLGPEDEFKRGTPRTTMQGYLIACRAGDYERGARYLDLRRLTEEERPSQGARLARQLKVVLDRMLWVDLEALSPHAEGNLEDQLPADRDRIGRIETSQGPVEVLLQRVPREDRERIWQISSSTVARIDSLYDEFGYGALGEILPAPFFEVQLIEVQLWQWIGLLVLVVVAYGVSWLASSVVLRLLRNLSERTRLTWDDQLVRAIIGPFRLVLFVLLFAVGSVPLAVSAPVQRVLGGLEQAAFIIAVAWLLLRLIDLLADLAVQRLSDQGQGPATQFVPLGRKTLKVLLVVFAALAVLDVFGFNVTAVLAGLGIGGLALALAAQKTIENLFGGVTLLADRPIAVGQFCRFGDKIGTVEEIGLRSTRVRTLDRTIVTVPNAEFSSTQIENYAVRDRMRLFTMIGVRYETTPDQLRYLLAELRSMLLAHPKVTPDPARVRFVGFGAYSLDLEVFAYVSTSDWNEFLHIREDIYLRVMDIVERSGTGFAFPSQTTYLGKDDGLPPEKVREVEALVEEWRQQNRLPFPDFDPDEKVRMKDTVPYPPEGSVLGAGA
jgi:MscS family membrane protein